ncbi:MULTISPECIES: DUF6725 family protein [unclassified Bifidobacterium]|uniref:DUF6725 family protein n=1 Tax=unclassified Bifidobacterium TaxID=2608897 RepID=UPI0023F8B156|nr:MULTISPECIES: DUF6725 family protein [unclassified Bifidobacterium]WEV66301.1 hypothetical protein OZX71_02870 [Bifidobacterium sp. ESL0764]WEV76419.1 hypothetical protein OZX75_04375 [Bifidobacterium sp. ESL0800]
MPLPKSIPAGARLMVRTLDGRDERTGRQQFRDFLGHVRSWDGKTLCITRDPAANGSRPAQDVDIPRERIVALKPIPERKTRHDHPQDV